MDTEYEASHDTYRIARKMLDILPLILRVMAGEMRTSETPYSGHQMPVLAQLQVRPYTLSELAERLTVSPSTMSTMITAMENNGLVLRERDSRDRRVVWIHITDHGHSVFHQFQDQVAERIAPLLHALDPNERERLANGLGVLAEVFAAAMERDPQLNS